MKNFMHQIGSPRSVVVFEAAARNLNFTQAAQELNVSQPAVSRQIRDLEEMIGCRLFHRSGNAIELTRSGQQLAEAVEAGLGRISSVITTISETWKSESVAIRSHVTLLSNFVIPLWTGTDAAKLNVAIEIQSARNDAPLAFEGPGIAILYGNGLWPGYAAERLLDDQLYPVCAPATRARYSDVDFGDMARQEPLLQLSNYVDPEMNWSLWIERFNLKDAGKAGKPVFNDYEMLLQTCKAGRGIAIGSACIIAPSLEAGSLVRVGDFSLDTDYGYYLVYDPMIAETPRIRRLLRFFLENAARFTQETRRISEASRPA
jgi:LysR family transcriptional regulator, glycine cleavage system transcriptional activator